MIRVTYNTNYDTGKYIQLVPKLWTLIHLREFCGHGMLTSTRMGGLLTPMATQPASESTQKTVKALRT